MLCLYCGSYTDNPKFCSQSHAAMYNNPKRPSRKKIRIVKPIIKIAPSKTSKVCAICKIEKPADAFSRTKAGKLYSYCKPCDRLKQKTQSAELKRLCVEYKGGKCVICGYNKCYSAMEFHHRNPLEKDFAIAQDGRKIFSEKIKLELDKCDLVCSNCHREIHAGMA